MSRILAPDSSPFRHNSDNSRNIDNAHGSGNNVKMNGNQSNLNFTRTKFESRSRSPEELKKNAYSESKPGSSSKNPTQRLKANAQLGSLKRYSAENSEDEDLTGSEATTGSINKRFKSALQKFEYDGPDKKQDHSDIFSSLSDLSSDENETRKEKPKKRKFKLGLAKAESDQDKSSDIEMAQSKPTKKPVTPSAEELASIDATVRRIRAVRLAFTLEEVRETYEEAGRKMLPTLK